MAFNIFQEIMLTGFFLAQGMMLAYMFNRLVGAGIIWVMGKIYSLFR